MYFFLVRKNQKVTERSGLCSDVHSTEALGPVSCYRPRRSGLSYVLMSRGLGLFSADADFRGSNNSLLLQTLTYSGSLVKICGLTQTHKFQDLHISAENTLGVFGSFLYLVTLLESTKTE